MKKVQFFHTEQSPLKKKTLVELANFNRIIIENHYGIEKYSTDEILVKTTYGGVSVIGSNLCLININKEQLAIQGEIDNIRIYRRQA